MNRTKELKELAEHMRETAAGLRYYGGLCKSDRNLAAVLESAAFIVECELPKEPEKTGWFPTSVHPVRDGVYETDTGFESDRYAMFKNGEWFCCRGSIQKASKEWNVSKIMSHPSSKWRGLTHEAK